MRSRILIFSLLITLMGIVIFSLISTEIYYNNTIQKSEEYLKVYINVYDENIYSFDKTGADKLSEKLNGARITFLTLDGITVADSEINETGIDHSNRDEIIKATKNGEGFSSRTSETVGKNLSYYCKKFDDKLVRVSINTSSQVAIFKDALPTMIWFLCLDILGCLVFAFIATGIILKPVEELTKEAALNRPLNSKYKELKPVIALMNEMNDKISEKISEINKEKELVVKATTSKNEFISNITHEMNTPLTSIKGFAELLETDTLTKEQKDKAIKTILSQSERLTNLISCVINYNQIDNDELPSYEVDISKIANETLEILKPQIEKRNITLIKNIENNVIVYSRHERITEILGNLIRNAIKYNKENGELEISISKKEYPVLVVRDTGVGVDKENQDKIFDRFFTVDKSHNGKNGGFGLGLAVVKKLCRKAGWTLNLESEIEKGSKFTIIFKN